MAIGDTLKTLNQDLLDAYNEIDNKEGIIPEEKNSHNLKEAIATIPTSGTQPKLNPPAISLEGNILTIRDVNNADFTTNFKIYSNGSLLVTVLKSVTTINLASYFSEEGSYTINVTAIGISFTESDFSNSVEFKNYTPQILTMNLTHLTSNAPSSFVPERTIKFTLIPEAGYGLPERITFSSEIVDASYDNETGEVTFIGPFSNCSITGVGVNYSLTIGLTKLTSNAPTRFAYKQKVSFILIPDNTYSLPESITFGPEITDGIYNNETGEVTFTGPRENTSITARGIYSGLKLTSAENGSIISYEIRESLTGFNIQISSDGINWEDWDGSDITLNNGEFRYIRNTSNTLSQYDSPTGYYNKYLRFKLSVGKILADGDISSMINFAPLSNGCFGGLFASCTALISAPKLPATQLTEYCYAIMFQGCTSLTQAPELPALNLNLGCYYGMFHGCSSIITSPELPATGMVKECYRDMFYGCDGLIITPNLPATILAESCYEEMFYNCENLQEATPLLSIILAPKCYKNMFGICPKLTTVQSILPATKLDTACYEYMFQLCESLITAPELPENIKLAVECCYQMFQDCTSLTKAPSVLQGGYLSKSCYSGMFAGCTALVTPPKFTLSSSYPKFLFPAESSCYGMFQGCTSLTQAPYMGDIDITPVTGAFDYMFRNCSSLKVNENGTGTKICSYSSLAGSQGVREMFAGTGGTFTGTPTEGKTYNYY